MEKINGESDKESDSGEFSNFDAVSSPLKDDNQEIKQRKKCSLKTIIIILFNIAYWCINRISSFYY